MVLFWLLSFRFWNIKVFKNGGMTETQKMEGFEPSPFFLISETRFFLNLWNFKKQQQYVIKLSNRLVLFDSWLVRTWVQNYLNIFVQIWFKNNNIQVYHLIWSI